MRELGNLGGQLQIINFDRLKKADRFAEQNVEKVDLGTKPNYTIDEILDRVEEGDVSVLVELGIAYTEISTETGDKKISFKYEGVRYTVHVITENTDKTKTDESREEIVVGVDGNNIKYEYDSEGNLVKATFYDENGNVKEIREYNENGYKAQYFTDGKLTTEVNVDKQGRPEHQVDYNPDGSVARIWDVEYREDGSHKSICKNPDGSLFSVDETDSKGRSKRAERYKNGKLYEIIETTYLEDGSHRQVYKNANGVITCILVWSEDGKVLKNVTNNDPNFIDELRKLADDLAYEFLTAGVPIPPSRANFATDEEFEKAFAEYENEKKLYDKKIADYNLSVVDIEYTESITKTKQQHQRFNQKIERLQIMMGNAGKLGRGKGISFKKLANVVTMHQKQYERGIANKYGIFNKIRELGQQRVLLNVPEPPRMTTGMTEKEYQEAFAKYEYEKQQYELKVQNLIDETNIAYRKIAQIDLLLLGIERNIQNIIDNVGGNKVIGE